MSHNLDSKQGVDDFDTVSYCPVNPFPEKKQRLNVLIGLITSALRQSGFEELVQDVPEKVVEILGFEECLIYLYDAASNELVQKAASGLQVSPSESVSEAVRIRPGQGLVGRCAESLETLLANDIPGDPADKRPRLAKLCVPIVSDGRLVGVIDSESCQRNFYSDEHVQLITAVAAIVATKFQSHRSIDELRQTVCQLEYAEKLQQALFNISELVYTTDSLDEFYQQMHGHVSALIDADVFFVALMEDNGRAIHIPYPGEDATPYPMPGVIDKADFASSLIARVISRNTPLMHGEEDIESLTEQELCMPCQWDAYAWLGVPFVTPSGIRGAIGVQRIKRRAEFNRNDQELMVYISQHVSNAIMRKQDESTLQTMARSDALTSLPNRTLVMERLERALKRDKLANCFQTHVFFIDLDRFKHINDAYGHHVGDQVLQDVGDRIQSCLRDADTLGRMSGDEFAIVLEGIDDIDTLEAISRRIIDSFKEPVATESGDIKLSASIGVCSASEQLCDAQELLKMADHAMYQAKDSGRGEVVINSQSESQISQTRRVEAELATALANEELELHYQPVFSLKEHLCVGYEVLTRWRHPELGLLYPDKFIDIAQKSGQIIALDCYVLSKSAELLKQWREEKKKACYLNVNISGRTLISPEFVDVIETCYRDNQLLPGSLNIEITEQCLIGDLQGVTDRLAKISKLGAKVFLDDFGTGYSSLKYLHELPIDVLKIDRSFVQSLHEPGPAESIIKTIITLANTLGIGIVAEGIEEDSQMAVLSQLSVDHAQGYLLGRPVPIDDVD